MCLLAFAWRPGLGLKLAVAANRDEFYSRPTVAAHFWEDAPDLLAGRDLSAGGTWLGVTRSGRFAAVTNFREPGRQRLEARSRGGLVSEFLLSHESPGEYLKKRAPMGEHYNGFNLLASDGEELHYWSNRGGAARRLPPGIYGLSNHLLDTPWPKVERARAGLRSWLQQGGSGLAGLGRIMADPTPAADSELPHTGVTAEWERLLSSMLIESDNYGTRSTSVLTQREDGWTEFLELARGPDAAAPRRFGFQVGSGAQTQPRSTRERALSQPER